MDENEQPLDPTEPAGSLGADERPTAQKLRDVMYQGNLGPAWDAAKATADAAQPPAVDPPWQVNWPGGAIQEPTPTPPSAFTLEDLTTAPPEYWTQLDDAYAAGEISSDDLYLQRRQRQHDEESPLLQMTRAQTQAEAPAPAQASAPTEAQAGLPPPPEREPAVPDPLGQRSFGDFQVMSDAGMVRRDAQGNLETTMSVTKGPLAPEVGDERLYPQAGPTPTRNAIGWTSEDTDIVRAAVRGPLKAVDATGSFAAALGEYLTGLDLTHIREAEVADTVMPGEPTTTPGMFAQGIAQFLTVAGPVGLAIKTALAGASTATAFGQRALQWALTAEGADLVADFLAFEPNDPRAANLLNEYFPNAPDVVRAITDYLAATGDDSQLEGRLKNVLEGRLATGAVLSVLGTVKGLKLLRAATSKVPLPDLDHNTLVALDRLETLPTSILRSEVGAVRIPGPAGEASAPPAPIPKKEKVERGPRVPPKPPSLDREVTYAEMGKGSNSWYHGVGDYVKRKLGVRDGNVFLDFMAIASQGQKAGSADLNIAIDAFNRFRRGENPEDLVKELKIGNVTGPNIRKHLSAYMQGKPLVELFGDDALKVRDYRRALDGDPNVVVVDRWIWRSYYYDEWNAAKAKVEAEGKQFNSWEGTPTQYRMIQARITEEARRQGLNPSDLQAQIWAGIKLATEGPKAGGLAPMRSMVKTRFDKGEIKKLPGQSVADLLRSETITRTAGILAALVAGNYAGNTDEEQAMFALMAAGIRGPGAKAMAKDLANLMPAAAALRNSQVAHEGRPKRVYHGTTQAFEQFDPAKVDPNALYGPGFYHTEDPKVAGGTGPAREDLGYARPRGTDESTRVANEEAIKELLVNAERIRTDPTVAAQFTDPAQRLRDIETAIRKAEYELERVAPRVAPQVRPAYLDIQRPFDIDKMYSPDEVDRLGIAAGLPSPEDIQAIKAEIAQLEQTGAQRIGIGGVKVGVEGGQDSPRLWELHHAIRPTLSQLLSDTGRLLKGQEIYDELAEMLGGKAQVNQTLQEAGFDGITHIGGARTGTDPHRVWIAFKPEQIHSPFEVAAEARMAKAISGGGPAVVMPDDPRSMAQQYAEAVVEARRGGPRTHPQVQAEAQSLIDLGLVSWDYIKSLKPGATLSDAPTTALVMQMADSGMKMRALTQQALQATDPAEALFHAKAVVQQLWMHAQLDPKRIGVLTESGRTMSALTDPTSGLNRFLQQFEFLIRDQNAPIDPMKLVQAIADFQDPGQLAVLARSTQKPGWLQVFNEYYVNSLLWGPKSWMANALGNSVSTFWAIPERALAARMGDERGIQAGEAIAMVEGLTNSIVSAWRLAADAFKKGESQFEQVYGTGLVGHGDKIDLGRHQRAISADTFDLVGTAGQAVDAVGNLIRFPMRVLASTDDFFKVINYNMELSALASREARANLQTTSFKTPRDYAAALDAEKARIMADPPLSVKKSAESFALYQTLTKELGEGGQLIQQWANRVPGGRILAPIIRTPINAFKYAGERTPLALATMSYWKTINGPDRAAADLAKARMALGSMTMAVAATMAYGGLLTGKGPSEPRVREKLEATGWKPYSLLVGNTYVGINRLEPVGMLLNLAADYVDAMVNSDAETVPQWAGEAVWALTVTTAKAISSRTFVTGMAETMAFMSNPDRASDQYASRFLQSLLPLSGLLRQSAGALDPTMREAEGVIERIMAQTPGVSRLLPPKRTLLDAEKLWLSSAYGPIGISRGKQDAEANVLVELGVNVPQIEPIIEMNVRVNRDQQDYWAVQRGTTEIGGKTLRERIAATMASPGWDRWNNEMRALRLEEHVQQYHAKGKDMMLKEYPDVKQAIRKAEQAVRDAQREGQGEPLPTSPTLRSLTRPMQTLTR